MQWSKTRQPTSAGLHLKELCTVHPQWCSGPSLTFEIWPGQKNSSSMQQQSSDIRTQPVTLLALRACLSRKASRAACAQASESAFLRWGLKRVRPRRTGRGSATRGVGTACVSPLPSLPAFTSFTFTSSVPSEVTCRARLGSHDTLESLELGEVERKEVAAEWLDCDHCDASDPWRRPNKFNMGTDDIADDCCVASLCLPISCPPYLFLQLDPRSARKRFIETLTSQQGQSQI